MNIKLLCLTILSLSFSSITLSAPTSKPYVWKSVQIVGGGFVDGIIFHPTAKGVCYARTDMGGAYRWNDKDQRWDAITDWISYEDRNSMGVESIAVDPSDPDRVYLACGTYTGPDVPNAAIFRSNDRGKTFQRADVPFKMGGNEDGRGNGERLMVDPHDGKILYFGSRNDGLWKSIDRGATWSRVESFPDVKEAPPAAQPTPPADPNNRQRRGFGGFRRPRSSGIITVVFDPTSGSKDKACSTIYVAVSLMSRDNLFCSKDSGQTWQPVMGQPTQYRPNHAVLASNGMLYISYGTSPGPSRSNDGGVWKYNTRKGLWTDITPEKSSEANSFGYAAVSVDASNPDVVITSAHYRQPDEIFRTTDGGKTWKPLFKSSAKFVYDKAPYIKRTGIHWMFDIEIDPANPNHAIFTTGYGGHETFNLTDADKGKPTVWSVMSTGIEETVALELLSPPKGAPLITAIGDYGGFVHWDLDKPAPEGSFDNPPFGNTNGVACGDLNPQIIVRVGNPSGNNNRDASGIAYSLNEGKTWQPANPPQSSGRSGFIAVSADGQTWVWTPGRMAAYVTSDRGANWKECSGLSSNIRVIADRVNPKKFYAMDLFKGKLFVSIDSAVTFTEQTLTLPDGLPKAPSFGSRESRGDSRGGQDRLYAAPGKEGDLWLAAFNGLYHSIDTGKSFVKLDGVQEMHAFGFGKAAPKADYSALYMIGIVDGIRGVFRSDDIAKTWVKINDDQHQWGLVLQITGDPKKYGRVYVGTHGRGTLYGDPSE